MLGTAQIGMQYGIANKTGQPDFLTAKAIIKDAWDGGIREFDSAQGYGEIEKILGKVFNYLNAKDSAKVVTKFSPAVNLSNRIEMRNSIIQSLNDLGIDRLHGILLHREEMLNSWNSGIGASLSGFKSEGLVEHIGVSVSNPEFADIALEEKDITMIQIPSNIFDRRFERAGIFEKAVKKNKIVYVRSAFLQGLLLLEPKSLSQSMHFTENVLKKFGELAEKYNVARRELAMGFVIKAYLNAKIIFGAETSQQVKSNLSMWENHDIIPDAIITEAKNIFTDVGNHILNPGLWPNALKWKRK